jgi:magnesium-transporting ATPase (P-type)
MCQLFYVFECRSEYMNPLQLGFRKNKFLLGTVLISVLMQLGVVYHAGMQAIFHTAPLPAWQWVAVVFLSGNKFFWSWLKFIIKSK